MTIRFPPSAPSASGPPGTLNSLDTALVPGVGTVVPHEPTIRRVLQQIDPTP